MQIIFPYLGSMLNILRDIYSPLFFTPDAVISESKKRDFILKIHEVLANLTEQHFKLKGLIVFYVPVEASQMLVDDASKNKDLVSRLEGECIA